eukprot:TRINITY_DN48350_c0_g1_i1.p1 TRINITY_DN48350_c0_g1~~TRINITY_DN48350_c0_g1_i1.p1  ORF type:complete len:464 (+),score=82.35 TRINITY_DN48350_c0_g1_i1:202-1593(+)
METPRTLASLCNFFGKINASAAIFTDAKIDDAIFLWTFFLLNFWRPADHRVRVSVNIIGVQDRAGAVAMVRHLVDCAQKYAAAAAAAAEKVTPLANVVIHVWASQHAARDAPRHEIDTYKPYHDGTDNFPQACDDDLAFFQDQSEGDATADLICVVAQYFSFEMRNEGDEYEKALWRLVPSAGGVLAFQAGFNTNPPRGKADDGVALWTALVERVRDAGASVALISNAFSFDGKAGTMEVTNPYLNLLRTQSELLWGHLIQAGVMESFRFCVDQMAKWLSRMKMEGVDYDNGDLGLELDRLKTEAIGERLAGPHVPRQHEVSAALAGLFVEAEELRNRVEDPPENPVVVLCRQLHELVSGACGAASAEYLRRAVANFERHGTTIEVTDGQHFAVLLQSKEPLLSPLRFALPAKATFLPSSSTPADGGDVVFGVRHANPAQSVAWMSALVDPLTARPLAFGVPN